MNSHIIRLNNSAKKNDTISHWGRASERGVVIQKALQYPKGVMLWSLETIQPFAERAKEDIVYGDATGSIIK